MTVAVQPVFSSSVASGSTTVFPYPFKIVESTDLKVSVNGVVQTSGYTVSGVGNGLGGDVTFSVAPAMGATVLLELDPILSRDTDYQQYGPFPAGIVNADFDRMWKALQKFANDFKRSLKLPTDTGTDQVVNYTAGERANALLSFDASGNLTITPITSIAVSVSAGSFTVDTFSGDGVTTGFTLSRDPGIKNNTAVFVDGAYVKKSAYSIAGTTLTFTAAPALGTANVEVTQSVALTAGAPADGTVTVASLADSALAATTQGLAKMADGFLAASTAARAKMADKFVTLAKMADIATGKLLGNVSGVTGAPAEISEASQAEAEAGLVQTRWMNPLRTAQAIAAQSPPLELGTMATATGLETHFDFPVSSPILDRITLAFSELSLSGTDDILVQFLVGGVPETSGYVSTSAAIAAAGTGVSQSTSGFVIRMGGSDAAIFSGTMTLIQIASNKWVAEHNGKATTTYISSGGGSKTVASSISGVRVAASGSNIFDGGSVNPMIG